MNEGIITSRYAKALYQAGDEDSLTVEVKKDIELIQQIINESPEFNEFILNPIYKEKEKLRLLNEIFQGNIQGLTLRFLVMLVNNKRVQFLYFICLTFLQLYKKEKGIKEGTLITAHKLNKEQSEEIGNYIRKKFKLDIEFKELVDPSLIGGFKLRIDDNQIDASIASKIHKIRTELINS
jgi:F-type H+-transporting ATPase subunit delta